MKVECRLACGVLVGRMEVSETLMGNDRPAVRMIDRHTDDGFQVGTSIVELIVARWRDTVEAEPRRIFKVKLPQVQRLRRIRGFAEDEGFKFYDEDELRERDALAEL